MKFLCDAEQILKAGDLKTEPVPVPEWAPPGTNPAEVHVLVRELSGEDRDLREGRLVDAKTRGGPDRYKNYRAWLASRAIVNEDGKRVFNEKQVAALSAKSGAVLDRIHDVVVRLSGLDKDAVEEAEKNCDSGPNETFSSDSA